MNDQSVSDPTGETARMIFEQADRLFAGNADRETLARADRGEWPDKLWHALSEAGLPLALVAEEHGGVGLPAVDAFKLIRRSAYHTLPVPLAETMLGQALWAHLTGEPVDGMVSFGSAATGEPLQIADSQGGWVLHGVLKRVPWGERADHVVVHARDDKSNGWLAMIPRVQARVENRRNLAYEPRDTLLFDGLRLPPEAVRQAPPEWSDGLLPFGALLRAQQLTGAMERCIDHSVTYAMERHQFGRPIARFQAIQHMLAEAAGHYAAAAAAADLAAEAYGTDQFALAVAIAKARTGEAAGRIAEISHQVHGAMGFTQEHPLHFATRRLWSWRDEFGHETYWQEQIGRLVCAAGGEALWSLLVD